jgi:hypothetical protein
MRFKRTHVPGEQNVDVERLLAMKAPADWRAAVGLD